MAKESAVAFRDFLKNHPEVELEARELVLTQGHVHITDFAKKHGYEFTEAEGQDAWDEVSADGELTDFELEMVSGGGKHPCNTDDVRFSQQDEFRANDGGVNNAIIT